MMNITRLSTDDLLEFPGNARRGDIEVLVESLKVNGQYRPIVVQKNSNYVLAGNHLLRASRILGWEFIDAVVIDCDDQAALKIVLADNRTADLGDYNDEQLQDLLTMLEDFEGTGYSEADLAELDEIGKPKVEDEPEIQFAVPLSEENQYIVLVFDNSLDWQMAQEVFDIRTVKAWDYKDTYQRKGLGRVVEGAPILEKLRHADR